MSSNRFSVVIDIPQPHMHDPIVKEIREVVDGYGAKLRVSRLEREKLIWRNGILSTDTGREIVLTSLHRAIFNILADNPNQQLSYEEIVDRLEAQSLSVKSPTNFRVLLHRLRKRLGSNGNLIQTERDNGYMLRVDGDTLTIS